MQSKHGAEKIKCFTIDDTFSLSLRRENKGKCTSCPSYCYGSHTLRAQLTESESPARPLRRNPPYPHGSKSTANCRPQARITNWI